MTGRAVTETANVAPNAPSPTQPRPSQLEAVSVSAAGRRAGAEAKAAQRGTVPILAVSAVVVSDGRLLMVKRTGEPAAGCWSLPGGRVEAGETLHDALLREVHEETSAQIRVGELIGVAEEAGIGGHFVILGFRAELVGPSAGIAAGDDASEVAWVRIEDVAGLDLAGGLGGFLVDHAVVPAGG